MSEQVDENTQVRKICVSRYNLKQLAAIYKVSKYLMRKAMKPFKSQIGEPDGYDYVPKQVRLVFRLIPLPSNVRIVSRF
ncbi:MAG: hypothetical protein H0W73_11430 [Bacteroidetes bacterium]|nr:hypothetical protein [Bacteroidota bacterium]